MKLLIIEDSERLRRSLSIGFDKLGYAVDSTGDGKEGLAYALSCNYNAIILDLMLPSLDGISILRQLRDRRVNSPVIILSAKDLVDDKIKGLDFGADDYVCKPFSFDELHSRIKTLIRRAHNLEKSQLLIKNLTLDFSMREVSVDGQNVSLTPSEYTILECLAMNQGRIITFSEMEDNIYTTDTIVSKNAIEVHLSSLRKKLRCVGLDNFIQTRRGFGYFIEK